MKRVIRFIPQKLMLVMINFLVLIRFVPEIRVNQMIHSPEIKDTYYADSVIYLYKQFSYKIEKCISSSSKYFFSFSHLATISVLLHHNIFTSVTYIL